MIVLVKCGLKIYIPIIFRDNSLNVIKWWLYDLYTVHGDMMGHTGGTMSLGHWLSTRTLKKKINTQSCRFLGRMTLYQGSTGCDTLLSCRVSLLTSTSCIRTNCRKMGVSWAPMAQNTFWCIIFWSRIVFWLGEKPWNISQWERCLDTTSQNLCRDLF